MNVSLKKDTLTPELKRLFQEVKRPLVLYQAGAKAVQVEISKHLRALQARGNEKGWPAQHFFAGGADAVEKRVGISKVSDKGAEITIADPRFVHRIQGGRVVPKRRKFLAIPLTAEAYRMSGKGSLRESMPGLKVWKFKKGLFLVKEVQERRAGSGEQGAKKRDKSGKFVGGVKRTRVLLLFKLLRGVTHRARPDEMPPERELGAAAAGAMARAARVLLRAK